MSEEQTQRMIRTLSESLYHLAQAIESMASTMGDNNAVQKAQRAKRAANESR